MTVPCSHCIDGTVTKRTGPLRWEREDRRCTICAGTGQVADESPHDDRFTMRLFGDYLTLRRSQWLDLYDLVSNITDDGQALRARIRDLLSSDARSAA